MTFKFLCTLLLISYLTISIQCSSCSDPKPEPAYTVAAYEGTWHEVAKIQTAGGAYFERNCTCTTIEIKDQQKNVSAVQGCQRFGSMVIVNATLVPTVINGKYTEKIGPNSVGYWIIYMDKDYAVTYDCNSVVGLTNYCIHILSRNPHVQKSKIQSLAQKALDLGLNKNNLEMTITDQSDSLCKRQTNIFERNSLRME